jgi:pimeloyl-ACP methyl ester carboxylesterase
VPENVENAETPTPAPPPAPRVEEVAVSADLPAFVVRATGERRIQMIFIPGMCVHPAGYIGAFQGTAASRGDLVAVQADVSCGGDGSARRWSGDLVAMDRRIGAAMEAAGLGQPEGAVVIGYSQGAERAERLAAKWPERYAEVILIASPKVPSADTLSRTRGAVLMAGTRDGAHGTLQKATAPLRRAGIATTFVSLPGAHHGQMGEAPETTMAEALDFLEANGK